MIIHVATTFRATGLSKVSLPNHISSILVILVTLSCDIPLACELFLDPALSHFTTPSRANNLFARFLCWILNAIIFLRLYVFSRACQVALIIFCNLFVSTCIFGEELLAPLRCHLGFEWIPDLISSQVIF